MLAFIAASGVHFCSDPDVTQSVTYTLELVAPTTGQINNNIVSDPFAFDPTTRKLTVSGTNEYQSGGLGYHGDITLKLCINSGADCAPNFILTYTYDYIAVQCLACMLTIDAS